MLLWNQMVAIVVFFVKFDKAQGQCRRRDVVQRACHPKRRDGPGCMRDRWCRQMFDRQRVQEAAADAAKKLETGGCSSNCG